MSINSDFSEISSYTFKRETDEDELSLVLPASQSTTSMLGTYDLIENGKCVPKARNFLDS